MRVDNVSMGAITTYTFSNVTANHTIAATFTASTTALTVTKSGTGSGTVTSSPAGINCGTDCSEPFAQNTVVQLTAAPATNSTFTGWSGACVGNAATCTVTMDAARTVAAAFSDNGPAAAEPVEAVVSGDFNNDGVADMAIIETGGLVSYSTNVNSPSPTWIPVPGQIFSKIVAGNFRSSRAGDELAGITTGGGIFYTRDFLAWTQIPLTGTLTTLVAGNFNNARTGDELAGLAPDGTVFVTLGTSITAGFNEVNGGLAQLVSGDVNSDGLTDLIGLNSLGKILVSTNAGTTWTQVPGRLSQVVSADINGDRRFDIAGLSSTGTIWFTTNLGAAWTQVPGSLSQVVSADINGDGRSDIAGLSTTGTIWFTTNLGAAWTNVPGTLTQLISGDFNGNGSDDLAGVSRCRDSSSCRRTGFPLLRSSGRKLASQVCVFHEARVHSSLQPIMKHSFQWQRETDGTVRTVSLVANSRSDDSTGNSLETPKGGPH